MSDANLLWGGDLSSSSVGDIVVASDGVLGQQRILRRLLTNPGDYLWQPTYGAGLGKFVGQPCDVQEVQAAIRSQIFKDGVVARLPEPTIYVAASPGGNIFVQISYVEKMTGSSQVLSFSVNA